MSETWAEVWRRRSLEPARGSVLAQLMAADGLDTAFADISEASWREFALRRAGELGAHAGRSVYEVGCGAGAFLFVLDELGCRVGGLDASPALIGFARHAIPGGSFEVAEAIDLEASPRADVVISCGVFLYFPDLDYASRVIRAMVARALHAVAVLDVPDLAKRDAAITRRIQLAGGELAYRDRYSGLDHLYYDRSWLAEQLRDAGLTRVATADQDIRGYANGSYRFNAWGYVARNAPGTGPALVSNA